MELFAESEETPPEFDRLSSCVVPKPLVEEELNAGTAVAALLEEVRPEVELTVEPLLDEELCR